jgi:hypothetical protein
MKEPIDSKKPRNRFIVRFLVVGMLAYPVLMLVSYGLDRIWTPDYFSPSYNLIMIISFLLSPGAILMMDAEHWPEILMALPFVTVADALWYAFVGASVWYIREFFRLRVSG